MARRAAVESLLCGVAVSLAAAVMLGGCEAEITGEGGLGGLDAASPGLTDATKPDASDTIAPPGSDDDAGDASPGDGDDGGGKADSGKKPDGGLTDGGTGGVCEGNQQVEALVSAGCQACLEAQCCTQLKGCFNLPATPPKVKCEEFSTCISDCATRADPATCDTTCETVAAPGVVAGYDAIALCGGSKCPTPCGL